jgi:uncharacterized protein YjiS (DUF1127 family)
MESAMNALILQFATHPHHGLRWNDVRQRLGMWWQYFCSRSELEGLSDKGLQDIGISRCTAEFEAAKPFWMP